MTDSFAVGQVVCDDFPQLRKMPTIPLSAAHNIIVKFLIQVIQKGWENKESQTKIPDMINK